MKTTHQKQIKTFLKKEADNIYLPFLKSFSKSGKVAQVFQKMIDILPNIKKAKKKKEESSNNLLAPIQLSSPKKKTNIPFILKPSETVVKLPEMQKKELLTWVKGGKLSNKLEQLHKNNYILRIPAYEDGKNPHREMMEAMGKDAMQVAQTNLAKLMSPSDSPEDLNKTQSKLAAAGQGLGKSLPAKLELNATSAGGSEGAKVTVIADKPSDPPKASLVGEKGKEKISPQTGSVTPEKNVKELPKQQEENNKAGSEEAGSGAKQGGEALTDIATTALSFIPGLGAVGGALKGLKGLGTVGKMAGMAKGMGGGSPLSAIARGSGGVGGALGAAAGGGGGLGGALGAAAGGGGGLGGALGAAGGALGGLAGAAAMATPVGMALAAAPAVGAAVGGLASGIGSAVGGIASAYGSIGGALIGGLFGNGKEKETKPIVVQGNGAAPMSVTNITYQYDIYRKTADDSFMLPNYRREYG